MVIQDEAFAVTVLQSVNYYRLTGYMLSFKENDMFMNGVTFEQIFRVYEFDHKLRNLMSSVLEHIEIAARTCIAYHLAHTYGTLGYEDGNNFQDPKRHAEFITTLNKSIEEARRRHELFVTHHDAKYGGKLPVWSMVELLSFGTLSIFYANLKPNDKKRIAEQYFGVRSHYFQSWLRALSHVRNICAHHARIYNKRLAVRPRLYRDDKEQMDNSYIFAAIFAAGILCPIEPDWYAFVTGLEALVDEYTDVIELKRIGFPQNWKTLLRDTVNTRRFMAKTVRLRKT